MWVKVPEQVFAAAAEAVVVMNEKTMAATMLVCKGKKIRTLNPKP